jgi:transmembrane sensor
MAKIDLDVEKINRYFNGIYSNEDLSYVEEVFCDNNSEEELKHILLRQFYELLSEDDGAIKILDNVLHQIHYDINTRLSERTVSVFDKIIKWTLRIAGIIILPLVILMGIHWYEETSLKKEAWVEIKSSIGTRSQFSLPDGTTGWLNNNSSIRYYGNFLTDRKIFLNGEAFFDVFKDKKRPFLVNTSEISVKVLGTRFNISSYENEKNVEIVLEEGKLIFNSKDMNKSYIMHPNDLVVYDKTLRDFSTEVVEPQKYSSWTTGKLVFRNDPLEVIAKRLGKWYNIDVEVDASSTEDFRWRATFVNESLEEVLSLLKCSLPINYNIINRDMKPDETYSKKKVIIKLRPK